MSEAVPGSGEDSPPRADRPYHAKRPHKKSRTGCKNCKTRKVKCDEARPTCKHCQMRKEVCVYPTYQVSRPAASTSSSSSSSSIHGSDASTEQSRQEQVRLQAARLDEYQLSENGVMVVREPFCMPRRHDEFDMRLLWMYTTTTWGSFSVGPSKWRVIDHVLRVKIVQLGFQSPFLMDSILGLAALHLNHLRQPGQPSTAPIDVPDTKAITYRARAFEGYRKAIEGAREEDFPAILAGSLILCALTSETLREPNGKPLYIVDWMLMWRGIGLVMDLIKYENMQDTGLAPVFSRPPIDLNESALKCPSNLLFMVSSIKEGDTDFLYAAVLYDTLKYLGSLYKQLEENGFSPILNLRVIVWFTTLPKPFVEMAREHRPRALIIIAHYLVFTKLVYGVWWMSGIADRELRNIYNYVDERWRGLLRVPLAAVNLRDSMEIGRLLMGNHAWEPSTEPLSGLGVVDDMGNDRELDADYMHRFGPPGFATYTLPVRQDVPGGGEIDLEECSRFFGTDTTNTPSP